MQLTQEQKAAVAAWVEDGARLAEVQRRIHDEFGIQLTYMEVRLLVLDIGATPKDKPEPAEKNAGDSPDAPSEDGELPDSNGGTSGEDEDAEDEGNPPGDGLLGGKVSVEVDKVVRAGAMMSGTVTFSDGVTGSWILDNYGRPALTKVSKPGYQPSRADIEAFMLELQRKLGY